MRLWTILLVRGGTILITIGCAMFLVSLIPSATTSNFGDSGGLGGKTWGTRYGSILTPQQGLIISITANNTLKVYLLEVNYQTIYKWINETHPQNHGIEFAYIWNETYLIEFLEANPQVIAIQKEISDGKIEFEYTPTKITNVTLVLHNPNPDFVEVEVGGSIIISMAPKAKMQTLSQITIPIGFVLTLPWIINSFKTKRQEKPPQNTS